MIFPWQETAWQQWQQQAAHLGQAYLLSGAAGIGIDAFAREMAQGLLCQTPGVKACGQCAQCHQFRQATHPDFWVLKRLEDKKEITIDQVRELTDKVSRTAHQGGFKVVLVLETETLNVSAFNALLKTLEEPPERTVLILTTHRLSALPATIISRCRQVAFAAPSRDEALAWLQQALPQADLPLLKKALTLNWGGRWQRKPGLTTKRLNGKRLGRTISKACNKDA